jgi:ATP-dependent exoDNAse (exonuclease V) beta subunit
LENYNKLSGAKSKNRADEIAAILPILLDNRKNIIHNHLEIEKKKKIHTALLPLKVNKEIQDQLKFIEDENDLLMLSRFNVLINEQLRDEPSAFIYEKVGEQYQHYFFDEFQDTSFLQWQNFLPLRDHILSEENTSFTLVGDPKAKYIQVPGRRCAIDAGHY